MTAVRVGPLDRQHRSEVAGILSATDAFSDEEVSVALELFDEVIAGSSDYELVGAFDEGAALAGYACFGPTPATEGSFDLYWLAVHPAAQGRGCGRALVRWVEQELGRRGARLLVVETSSRADYAPTREFYSRRGYEEAARVRDFYAPADDRLILTTRLTTRERGVATA